MTKPPKHIFDKDFKYVHSSKQNLEETFKRIRKDQAKSKLEEPTLENVVQPNQWKTKR